MNMNQLIDYISQRAVNEKQVVNYFVEHAVRKEEITITGTDCYLKDVIETYDRCFRGEKTLCQYYPYAKFHRTDTRTGTDSNVINYLALIVKGLLTPPNKGNRMANDQLFLSKLFLVVDELKLKPDLIFDIYVDKNRGARVLEVLTKRAKIQRNLKTLFKKGTETHKIRWQPMRQRKVAVTPNRSRNSQ